ncbi:MAG: cytochrome c biogenesis protein CcsA [Chloroflexi bacterium]|nr:cytochrome c biogenesis protein CcsA [Chloroflexota bacterium]
MVELASYLFWTGLALAAIASLTYVAHVASASLSLRRLSAQTSAGTVTVSGATGTPNAGLGRLATTFAALTAVALTISLIARWIAVEHAPLSNLYEYTVALAWGISVAWLAFERTAGARRFGVVALPIVTAALGIATLFPDEVIPLIPALQNGPLLTLHVSVVMVSYAVLTVAFSAAVIYLVQGGEGRRRFAPLPGGEAAGDLAHRAVLVGFPLLALGIALGAWWANSAWGRYWGWDPKETSALVVLLALAAYFHARAGEGSVAGAPIIRWIIPRRFQRSWRPDPMWWLVAMWALLLFTYFGVNLWITGLHSYAGV